VHDDGRGDTAGSTACEWTTRNALDRPWDVAMAAKNEVLDLRPYRMGGFACLERGQLRDGREVVCRRLQDQFRLNWRIRRSFVNGTNIRQKLPPHPHIIGSLEVGGTMLPYELIDYIEGATLQEWRTLYAEEIPIYGTEILLQLAQAIHHVHKQGYVHLDVKPGNVIVQIVGEGTGVHAWLTDFDLALPFNNIKPDKKLRLGTFNYMAPEHLKDGAITRGSDIFAFGVLAYYFYTGKMPYPGDNAEQSRRKKLDTGFVVRPVQEICPTVHRRASELILQCLDRDPARRLATLDYAARELRKLRERNY
jgi:serine/threonine protein kinase